MHCVLSAVSPSLRQRVCFNTKQNRKDTTEKQNPVLSVEGIRLAKLTLLSPFASESTCLDFRLALDLGPQCGVPLHRDVRDDGFKDDASSGGLH